MKRLLLCLLFACDLDGSDMGWVKVADCATGPAWHIDDELICDDHQQTTFKFRPWQEGDDAETACAYCEGRPQ